MARRIGQQPPGDGVVQVRDQAERVPAEVVDSEEFLVCRLGARDDSRGETEQRPDFDNGALSSLFAHEPIQKIRFGR